MLAVLVVPPLATLWAARSSWAGESGPVEWGLAAAMYVVTILGVTVGFHRLLAHGAFKAAPAVRNVLTVMGSMALQGPVLYWVSNHRRHHRYSDVAGDPHSPNLHAGRWARLRGLWHAHVAWALETQDIRDWTRFAPELAGDPAVFALNRHYFIWAGAGLLIPAFAGALLHGGTARGAWLGLLWGGLVRLFLAHHVTFSVNSFCHWYGGRDFPTDEGSRNQWAVGLLALGEGWHNNHHAFPSSARFGLTWRQIDVGFWLIRGLALVGLAHDVRVPAAANVEARRQPGAAA
jgi:stearoyl-CoA desaturase (delta-9 desaturase)